MGCGRAADLARAHKVANLPPRCPAVLFRLPVGWILSSQWGVGTSARSYRHNAV